ncbi:unnamed protein product [Alopecurus aequalis]
MAEKWAAVKEEEMVSELKEERKAAKSSLRNIGIFVSIGAMFILISFLVPGITKVHQIMCWQNAIIAFAAAAIFVRMYLRYFRPTSPISHI